MSQRTSAGASSDTLQRIELAFPDLVGGFEVHQRELEFDGRPVADLLAWSQGRVLLISVVDGTGDDTVLRALDALAFARGQRQIVAAALPAPGPGSAPGLAPEDLRVRVVLVATTGFSAVQLDRLEALRGEGLWLLRKRVLRTKRGSHTRLEPLDVSDGLLPRRPLDLPEWAVREPQRAFLAQIAPDRLELALELLGRMRRIDPALEWRAERGRICLLLEGAELCRLEWLDGHLELSLDDDALPLPVRDPLAIDRALDAILGVHLGRLGRSPAQDPAAQDPVAQDPPASARAATEALPSPATPQTLGAVPASLVFVHAEGPEPGREEPEEPEELSEIEIEIEDEGELDEDLAQFDLHPMAAGPLLTQEEIQAFHDTFRPD